MEDRRAFQLLPFGLSIAILAVSTASIFIRFAQQDVPSLVIAALRLVFASLLLLPVVLIRHRPGFQALDRHVILLVLCSGFFLALHFATWITSLEYTSVASSVVFVSTGPLWVALLSPLLLNERLTQAALAGLGFAILGGFIIAISDACPLQSGQLCPDMQEILSARTLLGNFLALSGAWAVSGYLIIGRKLRTRLPLIPYIFLVYLTAAFILILIMLVAHQTPFGYPIKAYWWILLLAVIPQLIGHSTYNWALRYLPAALVAVTTLGEPIGSATLALVILKEIPSVGTLIGGILILTGIYLAARQTH